MKKAKSAKVKLEHQNGHALPFKFAKLLDPEASWDKVATSIRRWIDIHVFLFSCNIPFFFCGYELGAISDCNVVFGVFLQDQLGDVLHWIRQVAGLMCGLIWGAIPLVGAIWILV